MHLPENVRIVRLKDFAPAAIVLFLSMAYSSLYGDFAPLSKSNATAWMTVFRFARFTLALCLPLIVVPSIYKRLERRLAGSLVRIEHPKERKIGFFRDWLFRPAQGIGIGLVFGTRLITVLQLISGQEDASSVLLSGGYFQFQRLITITLITMAVSLLLSILWAFDDFGIRYFNKRDQEMKMIGKYAGTLFPFIFGLYGIFNLLASYSAAKAFLLVIEIVIVVYPPLAVFAVIHAYSMRKRIAAGFGSRLRTAGITLLRD